MEYFHPSRFDLIAKYIYVNFYKMNIKSNFYLDLYKAHIYTFNGGYEPPGDKKNVDEFVIKFNNLIESFDKNGFLSDFPIPIGKNNIIINGSHRLVLSIYNNIIPIINYCDDNGSTSYNYNFFLNRTKNNKKNRNAVPVKDLSINYCDYMALEYSKLQKQTRIMIIYPNINFEQTRDKLINIINKYGYIYYLRQFMLTKNGLANLICELYRGEQWIGGLFPKKNNGKVTKCFGNNKTTAILIHFNDLEKVIECKEQCRNLYKLEKHSLHVNDTANETVRIAKTVFNKNSIDFLNMAGNLSEKSMGNLTAYFNLIGDTNETYVVDGSIILEMYGIRDANDLDYISYHNIQFNYKGIELHTDKWIKYYSKTKDDILFNPENHFYFNGFKFVVLELIKQMKLSRNEEKDKRDVYLIEEYQNTKKMFDYLT